MSELVREGKVRSIGLCEVSASALRAAHREHPIAAVQSEYSLWSRQVEGEVLPACRELGTPFVAFSPLGRGFLTGAMTKTQVKGLDPAVDLRAHLPRFQDQNVDTNFLLVEQLRALSARLEISMVQVALAWVLGKGRDVHVIPGSTSISHLTENFVAGRVGLPDSTAEEIESVFAPAAVAGDRYPPQLAR
jgi:aryl-alcohol dehydrogenase-like predicted oxidoreductase